MTITYEVFLSNEAKLVRWTKTANPLTQRFFELHAVPEAERQQIDQVEYEALAKAMRARWCAQKADQNARKVIGKVEAEKRKTDAHSKILLGAAAIRLATQDEKLRADLFTLACTMPSADSDYLRTLLQVQTENVALKPSARQE